MEKKKIISAEIREEDSVLDLEACTWNAAWILNRSFHNMYVERGL